MKKIVFFIIALCSISVSLSQSKQFNITGTLISDVEKIPLEAATVHLETIADSSLVAYTISDNEGKFELEEKTKDNKLSLVVSYVGYENIRRTISLDKKQIDLGALILKADSNALDEIVITSVAPVTVKKDTLEFNVKSFKTKQNANVEDLLKKLPGVEVDMEGKIKVNGKDVDKLLVNGKNFFGNDPTIATRNLTKEMIKKIQITDSKTRSEAFTGEEGNRLNKTINLTVSEDDNNGLFGQVGAGVGTNDRYEFSGMLNTFKKEKRLSVLLGGNNINSPGFSSGRGFQGFGRRGGRREQFQQSGGSGITTSKNGGIDFSNTLSKNADVSGNYFYSESDTDVNTITERETILPDSRFFSNSKSSSPAGANNHRADVSFEVKLDSTLFIDVTTAFNYAENKSTSSIEEESFNGQNALTNKSNSFSLNESNNKSFTNRLNLTKRFGDKGAFLRFNVSSSISNSINNSDLDSRIDFYGENPITMENGIQDSIIRKQIVTGNQNTNNLNFGIDYRLPLIGKELFLDVSYAYDNNAQKSTRNTFDFNDDDQVYNDTITENLSSDFKFINAINRAGVKITYKKDKLRTSFNANYISRIIDNTDLLRPQFTAKETFNAIQLGANANYNFSRMSNMSMGYNLSNNPPQLSQLQTFEDVSNPLNIRVGNPDLEPENRHQLYLNYYNYNFKKRFGVNANFNFGLTKNQITTITNIDENLVRRTTYVNIDGNYNLGGGFNFNRMLKLSDSKSIRYGVGMNAGFNKSINFNNGVEYASKNLAFNPNAELSFIWGDNLSVTPNYRLSFNKTTFDIDAFNEQEFLTHSLSLRTSTKAKKRLEWLNDLSYNYNPNVAPGFQRSSWFWNSSVSYSMFKEKGMLTLKVYDLLNQNTNARRVASADYIQDTQSNILQRYFMLNFNWRLNKMGRRLRGRPRGYEGYDGFPS